MKKVLPLIFALVMCLPLCACVNDAASEFSENNGGVEKHKETIEKLTQQINEYEQRLDEYEWIIDYLEANDYDSIISKLEQMKDDAKKAEIEAKGIVEIVITIDNWDQYFEYVPTGYAYIRNHFNEITHMNMIAGIKLKDEYNMVENGGTTVNFELETYIETRACSVDFTTGSFEYGEVIRKETDRSSRTTRFDDQDYNSVNGFGSIDQVNNENGNQITTEVSIDAIYQILRAEGVLYIYRD